MPSWLPRLSPPFLARLALSLAAAGVLAAEAPELMSSEAAPPARAAVTTQRAAPAPAAESRPDRARAPTATLSSVEVRRELDIPRWLRPGEFVWNDEGAPVGRAVIVVNIRARILSVYREGVEIGRSSLIYGADNKPTPTGTFPILEKDADHRSNLYDAPMPHMLRLTWDGVAIHGSPALRDDLATRGCVGLPREFAALLFDAVRVGDRVIVWDGVTSA